MSTCQQCGTIMTPGMLTCQSCGFVHPVAPVPVFVPPSGTGKAVIGTTPMSQAIGGFFFILIGIIAAATIPQAGLLLAFPIIIGLVLIILGVAGVSITSQQVTFQQGPAQPQATYQSSFLKKCPRCGTELPQDAVACYKCGTPQN